MDRATAEVSLPITNLDGETVGVINVSLINHDMITVMEYIDKIMNAEERLKIEERIIAMLKTVYDPEIPVNIYDLGLIYKIDLQDDGEAIIDMTLTAPNCPAADFIMEDVRQKIDSVEGVSSAVVNLVFEPEWDKDMMSEEAKLDLGFL